MQAKYITPLLIIMIAALTLGCAGAQTTEQKTMTTNQTPTATPTVSATPTTDPYNITTAAKTAPEPKTYNLTGRVTINGAPAAGLYVTAVVSGGKNGISMTDADGTYAITLKDQLDNALEYELYISKINYFQSKGNIYTGSFPLDEHQVTVTLTE